MGDAAERGGHRAVLIQVRESLATLDFAAGRTGFFVRRSEWIVEFIHLHKYSFASSYRIHSGIRVLNDVFPAPALNGPDSHAYTCTGSANGSRYDPSFAPPPRSPGRCAAEVARWCADVGGPWFARFNSPEDLLTRADSPLNEAERERLRQAIAGVADPARIARSLRMLTGA